MHVEFTASPTGRFNLAYSVGEKAEIDDDLGLLLVTEGFARRINPPDPPPGDEKPEDRTDKKPKEKR